MRGSLAKMEVMQARAAQIEEHTKKEKSQKRISKGGSILAINALDKITEKRQKEANKVLQKATTALTRAINKQNNDLKQEGIANRAAKRDRR
jgi:cellobiose-specific phosphotransferase system component IIA